MTAPVPAAILRRFRFAAGNRLGRRPCDAFVLRVDPAAVVDGEAVARALSDLPAEFGAAFRAVSPPSAGHPVATTFAALWAAANACGRPLEVAIESHEAQPGEWLVLVEEGEAAPAPAAIVEELLAHLLSAAPPALSAAARSWVERHAEALAGSSWSVLRRALRARDRGWRAGATGRGLRVGGGADRRDARGLSTGRAGWIAATLAEDKARCGALLRRFGLPAPLHEPAHSADEAKAAAHRLGFPVVVKPIGASGGKGVSTHLDVPEAVAAAFARAASVSRPVLVERMLPGDDHRFLVIGGRVVSVVRKEAASVVGDGHRTLAELRVAADADPRRRGADAVLMPLRCDAATERLLAAAGLSWQSVPAAGRRVALQSAGNWDLGGTTREVAAFAHPDNCAAALAAVRLLRLDVAGVDFLLPDVRRSWRETGGGICEVNRMPGALIHLAAEGGSARPIEAFLAHWLDGMRPVPLAVVVGDAAADRIAAGLAAELDARGIPVGLANAAGLSAAGLPLRDPGPRPTRIARLMDDPGIAAAVAAVPAPVLCREGLGHERADMALLVEGDAALLAEARTMLARLGATPWDVPAEGPDGSLEAAADRLAELTTPHESCPR